MRERLSPLPTSLPFPPEGSTWNGLEVWGSESIFWFFPKKSKAKPKKKKKKFKEEIHYNTFFRLFFCMCKWYMHGGMCGEVWGKLWSWFAPSIFEWDPGIRLRLSGSHCKCFFHQLGHLTAQTLLSYLLYHSLFLGPWECPIRFHSWDRSLKNQTKQRSSPTTVS